MSGKFKPEKEDAKCAPSKSYTHGSCYTLESLLNMAAAFNLMLTKVKDFPGKPIIIRENKSYLVGQLTIAMGPICSDQLCWMEQGFIKALNDAEINNNTFLPKLPQGRFTWLNTTNITEKMEQYELKFKDFKFIGCVPMDFDELDVGIRRLNYDSLYASGIRRLGFIFNLDKSHERGSHWVSMFCDLKQNQIYYFDSCAKPPTNEIKALVNRIATWCYNRNIKGSRHELSESAIEDSFMGKEKNYIEKAIKNIKYNTIKHQKKNSECGVYSINFILRLLNGETFEEICENVTGDDEMNSCRKVYFRFE